MDVEKIGDYDELKRAILRRYDINEETYRQRFRSYRKETEESYAELAIRLTDLFNKWVQLRKKTREEVAEVMILHGTATRRDALRAEGLGGREKAQVTEGSV
jgi:broad specificity phosphatase PhoE